MEDVKDESGGQALVEFAIVIPVLVLLVTGIVVFSNLYRQHQTLVGATEAAARFEAICNGLQSSGATADSVGTAAATALSPAPTFTFDDLTTGSSNPPNTSPGTGYKCGVNDGDQIKVTGSSTQTINLYIWSFTETLTHSVTITEQ
jgi:Flp pilus assembly protein TadG